MEIKCKYIFEFLISHKLKCKIWNLKWIVVFGLFIYWLILSVVSGMCRCVHERHAVFFCMPFSPQWNFTFLILINLYNNNTYNNNNTYYWEFLDSREGGICNKLYKVSETQALLLLTLSAYQASSLMHGFRDDVLSDWFAPGGWSEALMG